MNNLEQNDLIVIYADTRFSDICDRDQISFQKRKKESSNQDSI